MFASLSAASLKLRAGVFPPPFALPWRAPKTVAATVPLDGQEFLSSLENAVLLYFLKPLDGLEKEEAPDLAERLKAAEKIAEIRYWGLDGLPPASPRTANGYAGQSVDFGPTLPGKNERLDILLDYIKGLDLKRYEPNQAARLETLTRILGYIRTLGPARDQEDCLASQLDYWHNLVSAEVKSIEKSEVFVRLDRTNTLGESWTNLWPIWRLGILGLFLAAFVLPGTLWRVLGQAGLMSCYLYFLLILDRRSFGQLGPDSRLLRFLRRARRGKFGRWVIWDWHEKSVLTRQAWLGYQRFLHNYEQLYPVEIGIAHADNTCPCESCTRHKATYEHLLTKLVDLEPEQQVNFFWGRLDQLKEMLTLEGQLTDSHLFLGVICAWFKACFRDCDDWALVAPTWLYAIWLHDPCIPSGLTEPAERLAWLKKNVLQDWNQELEIYETVKPTNFLTLKYLDPTQQIEILNLELNPPPSALSSDATPDGPQA
jgi:hypothetical protein